MTSKGRYEVVHLIPRSPSKLEEIEAFLPQAGTIERLGMFVQPCSLTSFSQRFAHLLFTCSVHLSYIACMHDPCSSRSCKGWPTEGSPAACCPHLCISSANQSRKGRPGQLSA